jgi:hypothetical protein
MPPTDTSDFPEELKPSEKPLIKANPLKPPDGNDDRHAPFPNLWKILKES